MRIVLLLAGLAIVVQSCHTSSASKNMHQPTPDVLGENLKGNVQKVETDTYLTDSATGKIDKLEGKGVETFNDSGFTTSYNYYLAKDSSNTLTEYVHDSNGFLTKIITTKNGKPLSAMNFVLDSADNYSLVTSFDSNGKKDVYYDSIKMNDLKEVISGKAHHPDGTLKMTFVNNYDSVYYKGGESKDSVGKLTYSSSLQLDDKKNAAHMEETSITKDSTTHTITDYSYDKWDSQGNWIEQTSQEKNKPKKINKRIITYKS